MPELKIPCCFCDKYQDNGGECGGLTQFEIDNNEKLSTTCFSRKAVNK